MSDLYLYHATDRKNLDSILTNGLLINLSSHAYKDFDCDGKIFLAFDANVAESYAEESDDSPDNIVILRINLSCLHEDCFDYDWNNRCAYTHEINSCVYFNDIPGKCISVCSSSNEPEQTIFNFKGTDLYEIITRVFDEEVETNMESEDDDY